MIRKPVRQKVDDTIAPHFAMHGILNEGNTCYVNAPLQLLFSLPHFREVILNAPVPDTTLTHAVKVFLRSFISTSRRDVLDPRQDVDRILRMAKPLSAAAVYAAIGARNADLFDFSHVQHDAEELFTFVLSTMHDELMEHCPGFQPPDSSSSTGVAGGSGVSAAGDDDDDGAWAEVGPKKTATKLSASTRMTLCYMLWIVLCVLRERVSFTP